MRLRDFIIIFVSLVVGVSMVVVAGSQLPHINKERQNLGLVINPPLKNAPPSLAFATVAMGAFRGLVVDLLWMRADKLKEEGQFFDAKQVADWITMLEPRFGTVWEFQGWNMAYNISVAIPASDPAQRWRWVRNGYELLRDKAIPLNPQNIRLYRELARIFQHKLGGISDDCHRYYKAQFAKAVSPVLGGTTQAYFKSLAMAPKSWVQVQKDPNLMVIVKQLGAADPHFAKMDKTFIHSFINLLQDPNSYSPQAVDLFRREQKNLALYWMDRFCRAYEVRHTWKMDPALIVKLNQKFGPVDENDPNHVIPLDWRHPNSHAIYWAYLGLKLGAEKEGRGVTGQEVNTDRIIVHSLQDLFRYGRMAFFDVQVHPKLPDGTTAKYAVTRTDVYLRPDLRMFDRVDRTWGALITGKYKNDRGRRVSLQNGYRNFLVNALYSFYLAGPTHRARTRQIYVKLRKDFPRHEKEFSVPMAEFVRRRLIKEMDSVGLNDARELIEFLLEQSYYLYAIGSDDEAVGHWNLANEVQAAYSDPNQGNSEKGRTDIPIKQARFDALLDFLNDPRYPSYLKQSLYGRIKTQFPTLFQRLQEEMKKERKQQKDNTVPAPTK